MDVPEIISCENFGSLVNRLRVVPLLNDRKVFPYANADIQLVSIRPEWLYPTSYYVHREKLGLQLLLDLWPDFDVDGFDTAITYRWAGEVRTMIPPVVEMSRETLWGDFNTPLPLDVPLIADGLHRVFLAKQRNRPITVLLIRNISHPYYAYPCNWARVNVVEEVPSDPRERKRHRVANYYDLYRDFGELGGKPRHPEEIKT